MVMEFSQDDVYKLFFGEQDQNINLEAVIMRQGDLDVVVMLDEIAALPDRSDRAIALQMMFQQLEGKD